MSTAAPAAPGKVAVPPSSLLRKVDGVGTSSVVGNGDVGHKAVVSDGAKNGSAAVTTGGSNGTSNGSRLPAASSSSQQQPKKRRVIEDDDDDDDDDDDYNPSAAAKPRPTQSVPGGGVGGGSGTAAGTAAPSGLNGSSSSHSGQKKKIVAGPSAAAAGKGSGLGGPPSKPGRKGNDDDDTPYGSMLKKKPPQSSSGASGSSGGGSGVIPKKNPSKNGVKTESKSFTIPKRGGVSASPRAPSQGVAPSSGSKKITGSSSSSSSSSSSPRPAGTGNNKKPSGTAPRYHDDDDDDFEQKPIKLKKRPEDFTRDPNSKSSQKRKLEEQRAKEEALKKKRRDSHGGSSSKKVKVKADPSGRRGSSSSSAPRSGGRGSGSGGKKSKPAKATDRAPKPFKEMTRAEKIEQAMKTYKWWEEPEHEEGIQWQSLEHNGAHFAPEYKPHGVKLKYDGKDVSLTPRQEEVATFYASMPLDGPQLAEQGAVFKKNFFADFKAVLGKGHIIKDFKLLDFSAMRAHLDIVKQIKRAATDGEKAAAKTVKEELMHKYSYAIVDNHLEKVGNYNVEPPGLFRGRGKHPKTGMLKARVTASDISLNCAEGVCVPQCSVPGYAWQSVQHDPSVTWLSKWDGVLAGTKYMMLAASSSFKGKSDVRKYDKAMKLKGFIERIRQDYTAKLINTDLRTKQIATAVWVIDKLALRVGGEKGDDEADTVGCCSLRKEHVTFSGDSSVFKLQLEFLGKDSMLFKETIDFNLHGDTGRRVFMNLQQFCKGKRQMEEVFDQLDPSILNQHLQSLMPGLTAKVFRTYNASDTLQKELPGEKALRGLSVAEKVALYNGANRQVAILCNHQRTVSNAQREGLSKQTDRLSMLEAQKKELMKMLRIIKSGKGSVKLKPNDKTSEEDVKEAEQKAKKAKANAKTDREKVAATEAHERAMKLKKAHNLSKSETSHLFAKTPSQESVEKRIETWSDKIKKLDIELRDKEDNKEVSLTTSKINYMDPRVSVAWCKRHEVPVEKVFAKTLRDKFVWAMNVPPEWSFSYETLFNSKQTTLDVPPPHTGGSKKKTTAATTASATKTAPKASAAAKPAAAKAKAETKPKAKPAASPPSEAKGKGKGKAKQEKEEEEEEQEAGSGSSSSSSSSEEDDESGSSSGEEESGSDEESGSGSSSDGESGSSSGEEDGSSESGDEDSSDDDDDEEEEKEGTSSSKKRRSSGGGGSGGAVKKARRAIIEDDDDEEEEEEEEDDDDSDFEA
eukprot:g5543.t1